jgi:C4-dicarboxylate-specific signal transduction histidine kinase
METQTYTPLLVSLLGLGLVGFIIKLAYQKAKLVVEISEVKQKYEKQLADRNTKLFGQSKYSELGMMSAGIAHEINNPLAVIQARTTQLLRIYKDAAKNQELGEGLQQILYTSERINRTIQGIREFVHQDENAVETDICLKDLLNDVLAFCGQRLKNHGVSLRLYNLERYTVRGNKIQLEQIFLNLINNSFDAIEFLPDKWIEMSVHEGKDNTVQIIFKDSGPGIPPEIAARIMEPFFTTKELGKGTGLGLSLARGIAEKHGGELSYVDDSGHTTFKLNLPKFMTNISPDGDWNSIH